VTTGEADRLETVIRRLRDWSWPAVEMGRAGRGEKTRSHCYSQVKGQLQAKRALEIAAAGGHNVLLMGPPGTGKTLLARRLPGILPPLSFEESLEATRIHSAAGLLRPGAAILKDRPFRAPHHTVSGVGLAGGGRPVRPGEISLAHHGVLFLDELPEFPRGVLETLRQPLEDGDITIVRAGLSVMFPARFVLMAAMNPCPCGFFGSPLRPCRCAAMERRRYRQRISGPLLDRFDMHVEVGAVEVEDLETGTGGETSDRIRERVLGARRVQSRRQGTTKPNGSLPLDEIDRLCRTDAEGRILLRRAFRTLGMSARSYHRVLKVARTVADLAGAEKIAPEHLLEALQHRILDRTAGVSRSSLDMHSR
jgi:magnesium chelatase family protein